MSEEKKERLPMSEKLRRLAEINQKNLALLDEKERRIKQLENENEQLREAAKARKEEIGQLKCQLNNLKIPSEVRQKFLRDLYIKRLVTTIENLNNKLAEDRQEAVPEPTPKRERERIKSEPVKIFST